MNWTKLVHSISRKELYKIFWILIVLVMIKIIALAGFSLMRMNVNPTPDSAYNQAKQKDSRKHLERQASSDKHRFDFQTKAHAQEKGEKKSSNKPEKKGSLSEQWQKLRKRQQKLKRKKQELQKLKQNIDKKLAKQRELKKKLESVLEEARSIKDKKIKHLVDVYSNMQPKKAAQALETLKQDIAVKILAGMQGRTAGTILSFVDSKKAASLSEALTDFQTPFAN